MNPLLRRAFSAALRGGTHVKSTVGEKGSNFIGRSVGQLIGGNYQRHFLKRGEQSIPDVVRGLVKSPKKAFTDAAKSATSLDKALITGGAALELPGAFKPQKPGDRGAAIGGATGALAGGLLFNKSPLLANIAGYMMASTAGSSLGRKLSGG